MRLPIAFAALAGFASLPAYAADIYTFDKGHTEIIFSYDHLGQSIAYGSFNEYEGQVTLDVENPQNSKIEVTIDPASVDTGVEAFDEHLKSADFFDVANFPEITFVSTGIELSDDNTAKVTGDLTIKDNTKPVTMDVKLNALGPHALAQFVPNYKDVEVAGFSATAQVLRSDFGVDFAPAVGNEVSLIIETELFKQK